MKIFSVKKIKKIVKENIIFIIVIFFVAIMAVFYGYKEQNKKQLMGEDIVKMVDKIMYLPKDEIPTTATIVDMEPIKNNMFFKNARVGDAVIIYTKSAKAVLYRPSENRIVEVGSLNIKL